MVSGNVENDNRPFVTAGQTANIILLDGARLYCEDGINVPAGTTLNVFGQTGDSGLLYCDADTNNNAAIGADSESGACGTITIHGGNVAADTEKYGKNSAGIGGGYGGDGGKVTIYGGIVQAVGASYGAGIGEAIRAKAARWRSTAAESLPKALTTEPVSAEGPKETAEASKSMAAM